MGEDIQVDLDGNIKKSSYWIKVRIVLKGVCTLKSAIQESDVQTDDCHSLIDNTVSGNRIQLDNKEFLDTATSSSNSGTHGPVACRKALENLSDKNEKLIPAKKSSSKKYPCIEKLVDCVRPFGERMVPECTPILKTVPRPTDKVALSQRIKSYLQLLFTRSHIRNKQEFETHISEQMLLHIDAALRRYFGELLSKQLVNESDDHLVDCTIKGELENNANAKQIFNVEINCSKFVVEKAKAVAIGNSSIVYSSSEHLHHTCGCLINSLCATHGTIT